MNKTFVDFPHAQVIVSDNGSTDETYKLRRTHMHWLEQDMDIGAFANMRIVLLAAKTEYCVYLGDDDYLLPEQVAKGIDYLERNSLVDVYYAPCEYWDEVRQESVCKAFDEVDTTFYARDEEKLWRFIIGGNVFPENAIYRRDGLEKILKPRVRAYWAFCDLANAYKRGALYFAKTPFYRNITDHPVGHRERLGMQRCTSDFDDIRGGLENLAFDLFGNRWNNETKNWVHQEIRQFITARLRIAHRILESQRADNECVSLFKRIMVNQ
jgi:glycosyltransferase involved in cell wall biosynthesis